MVEQDTKIMVFSIFYMKYFILCFLFGKPLSVLPVTLHCTSTSSNLSPLCLHPSQPNQPKSPFPSNNRAITLHLRDAFVSKKELSPTFSPALSSPPGEKKGESWGNRVLGL